MKVVLVKENDKVRLLEGKGTVDEFILSLRSRLTNGGLIYYELDSPFVTKYNVDGFVLALNQHPDLLETSDCIKKI